MYELLAEADANEDGFWQNIEEAFVQVEATFRDYPLETRDQALNQEITRFSFPHKIGFRNVSKDMDSREHFYELGRRAVASVAIQIERREFNLKFAHDWGVAMMCHGFMVAHILDDSDDLKHARGGQKSGRLRSKNPQRKWIAHQLIPLLDSGVKRADAEVIVAERIKEIIKGKDFPEGFSKNWFEVMITQGDLASTYDAKHLTQAGMRKLITQPRDDIPPLP
jgi:hypothetical protein